MFLAEQLFQDMSEAIETLIERDVCVEILFILGPALSMSKEAYLLRLPTLLNVDDPDTFLKKHVRGLLLQFSEIHYASFKSPCFVLFRGPRDVVLPGCLPKQRFKVPQTVEIQVPLTNHQTSVDCKTSDNDMIWYQSTHVLSGFQ